MAGAMLSPWDLGGRVDGRSTLLGLQGPRAFQDARFGIGGPCSPTSHTRPATSFELCRYRLSGTEAAASADSSTPAAQQDVGSCMAPADGR